jgi:hypothetical protein
MRAKLGNYLEMTVGKGYAPARVFSQVAAWRPILGQFAK